MCAAAGGIPAGLARWRVVLLTSDSSHAESMPKRHQLLSFLRKRATGIFGKIRIFGTTCRVDLF